MEDNDENAKEDRKEWTQNETIALKHPALNNSTNQINDSNQMQNKREESLDNANLNHDSKNNKRKKKKLFDSADYNLEDHLNRNENNVDKISRSESERMYCLDLRKEVDFQSVHFKNSFNLTWDDKFTERMFELPPKKSKIELISDDNKILEEAKTILEGCDYRIVKTIHVDTPQFWDRYRNVPNSLELNCANNVKFWKANPFLERFLEEIEMLLLKQNKPKIALDVACGSGRDAVELACRNWEVLGVDYEPTLLNKMLLLAKRNNCGKNVEVLQLDVESHSLGKFIWQLDCLLFWILKNW